MRYLLFCLLCWACQSPSQEASKQGIERTPTLADFFVKHPSTPDSVWIKVDKSSYQLSLYWGDSLLKTYPVVFGKDPVGDKQCQGDFRTPEGRFRIKEKYPHERWTYFLWIDYPTPDSWRKHRAAKMAGLISPQARIGGEIGIHGVPQGYDHAIAYRQNWTLGCISLTNADISELYKWLPVGAEVEIINN